MDRPSVIPQPSSGRKETTEPFPREEILRKEWKTLEEKMEEKIFVAVSKAMENLLPKITRSKEDKEEEEDEVPVSANNNEEPVVIELDEEIKNKRSANEVTVLRRVLRILEADEVDSKKRIIDAQLELKRRIFLLELVEKVGWGIALAYLELYPKDIFLDPSRLKAAAEYKKVLEQKPRKAIPRTTSVPAKPSPKKDTRNVSQYGNSCFRCGGEGHWAKDCPNTKGGRGTTSFKKQ